MFSEFLDYVNKGKKSNDEAQQKKSNGEPQEKSKQQQQPQPCQKEVSKSLEDNTSSSSSSVVVFNAEKRRIRVDYRIKYAYLDYVTGIDLIGLEALAEDVRQSLQTLDNSYLAIVNSLIILNERKKRQSSSSAGKAVAAAEREVSSSVSNSSSSSTSYTDFINSKVAENFRQSDTESLSSYPDTYEWTIDKFCDPATRDREFQHLFQDSKAYIATVRPIVSRRTKINMARFGALVRQGKSLLGIIELLNTNYSNNFLDIFRLS
ncbi:hypothetical protein TYRP_003266 [Tyrophagus putrescentiae]|nr:hypothetical protein TYRP_003266 [Tyrophagus putrescentiae]